MTSPIPGVAPAAPRTWSSGDVISVPRVRADAYNAAAFAAQARPVVGVQPLNPVVLPANTRILAGTLLTYLNTWNVQLTSLLTTYPVPVTGWYLLQGTAQEEPTAGTPANARFVWGWQTIAGGVTTSTDAAAVAWTSTGAPADTVGGSGAELVELNTATGDNIAWYGFTSNSGGASLTFANLTAEWVALPGGTLSGYTAPLGTVVTAPKPVSLWPPGPGGTLNASVSAGGSVLALGPVPGLRAGGTIGLDWLNSQQYQTVAETAGVASVAGGTVTLSGTLAYSHSAGAPVAIPVPAAFLNEQIRDLANFLQYPPILRATPQAAQSIPQGSFPTPSAQITGMTASADNFSGFASNAYTIPVSGTYLVYGLVYYAGASTATNWAAGISVSGGTTIWGDVYQSDTTGGAVALSASVRRLLRLTAGQTITLQAFQNSGSAVNTEASPSSGTFSRLIIVFRSF